MDPATSSGACSKRKDQYYRRKECCKVDEKHFVLDVTTLMGVCVQQNNDCAPSCIDQNGIKICSKGCNVLLPYQAEAEKRMVVCDSHKMVSCAPPKTASANAKDTKKVLCIAQQEKQVTARMSCVFNRDIWALGATCISRVFTENQKRRLHGEALELFADVKGSCGRPGVSTLEKILTTCKVVPESSTICAPMAMSY